MSQFRTGLNKYFSPLKANYNGCGIITLGAKNLMPKNFSYIKNTDEIFRRYIFRRRNFSTTNYLGGVIFLYFAIYTKFQNKIARYILIAKIHVGYFSKSLFN
jgi:hypothetical protein